MNLDKIVMKLDDAIEAGKDSKGNIIKIPVFKSVTEIDGELYGIIDSYVDPPEYGKETILFH